MKRLNATNVFQVKRTYNNKEQTFIVVIDRIKNDVNGNPRYEATMIWTDDKYKETASLYNRRYRLGGYYSEWQLAEKLVDDYLKELEDKD